MGLYKKLDILNRKEFICKFLEINKKNDLLESINS